MERLSLYWNRALFCGLTGSYVLINGVCAGNTNVNKNIHNVFAKATHFLSIDFNFEEMCTLLQLVFICRLQSMHLCLEYGYVYVVLLKPYINCNSFTFPPRNSA